MKLPNHVSETIKRLNPKVFGVVGLPNTKREPNERRQSQDSQLDKSPEGVGFRINIISIRSRLVDSHDNLRTGAKPLVDQITITLGFANDNNPRLEWDYHQIIGIPTGTIVLIERIE